ncbi:aminotransferase class III-fold pyridoxal phosphate-dependent enzyme [Halosolutus halophilus]|uniref:aminotransferase class III-fold pyridoxal phosphate-dependent enzyme n=1 Tax=Halosolutus halophilus TaxID=1552990 RepID=UPI002234FD78|nr:aminotransferase class III-fold pyridoxal phosphate-dependent enzyme [Halosolutus halophilus]
MHRQDHSRSVSTVDRAKRVIPGGINSTSRTQMMETRSGYPICFERASGAELFDADGNRYVDYLNGWGPIILGHADEDVNRAVMEAIGKRDIMAVPRFPCANLLNASLTDDHVQETLDAAGEALRAVAP